MKKMPVSFKITSRNLNTGKRLAYQTQVADASRLISKIKSTFGDFVTDPTGISDIFSNYYSQLYSSECCPEDLDKPNHLDLLTYPQVDEMISSGMGAPMTVSEVKEVIKSLQCSKSFYRVLQSLPHRNCPNLVEGI